LNVPNNQYAILIIGVGNLFRSDDAVGVLISRKLNNMNLENVKVEEQSGEGTSLMDSWKGYQKVFIIDAVSSGELPGNIHRLDPSNETIPAKYFSCSTHNFGVAEAIEMARTLDQLPGNIKLFGIEGKIFEPGEGLSLEVKDAAEIVTQEIIDHVS
jgi:hydrogenase maturation protease